MSNKVTGFVKKLTPYNIQKGIRYLKHFGVKEFLVRLSDRLEPEKCRTDRGLKRTVRDRSSWSVSGRENGSVR